MLPEARVLAAAQNVTINGLAILTDNSKLDQYYQMNVIQGPGAFVVKADDFVDFHRAIKLKLWREISYKLAQLPHKRTDFNLALQVFAP